MKFFKKCKDGGKTSTVDAYTLFECKNLFSVMLLRFDKGSRENFHSHAFNAFSWFLFGSLVEHRIIGDTVVSTQYRRSLKPKVTLRDNLHKVFAKEVSWCFTIRGPWVETWVEYNSDSNKTIKLTHGRQVIND